MKNRKREYCTSGSVRGEGGNILTYSAARGRHRRFPEEFMRDAVGVARKIAQDFLRSPEWTLGIDDPVFVAQRCQISREGFWIGQRHVLAEELQLSGTMSGSKLFQDKPSKQTRENLHGEKEVGPAGDPACPVPSRGQCLIILILQMIPDRLRQKFE
jgi:hypothetical protein